MKVGGDSMIIWSMHMFGTGKTPEKSGGECPEESWNRTMGGTLAITINSSARNLFSKDEP